MTTLTPTLDDNHRWHPVEFRQQAHIANGWERPKVWDGLGTVLRDMGIDGPSAEPGAWNPTPNQASTGVVTAGDHLFRYRYLDSRTGYVSDPSNEVTVTAPGSKKMVFTISTSGSGNIIRSLDAKVDTIVLEASVAGDDEFFEAARVIQTASSIEFTLTDVELVQFLLEWEDEGHLPPPVTKYVYAHRDRMWAFGRVIHEVGVATVNNGNAAVTGSGTDWTTDALGSNGSPPTAGRRRIRFAGDTVSYEIAYATSATALTLATTYAGTPGVKPYVIYQPSNNVFVSLPGFPESFPAYSFIAESQDEQSGEVRAGVGFHDAMLFFTRRSLFRLIWTEDPAIDGTRRPVIGSRGALQQRVVVVQDGQVFAMDRQGFWRYEGAGPEDLTPPVAELLEDVNWDEEEQFHAVYLPTLKAVRWYVVTGDDTAPKAYFQLEIARGAWSTGQLDVAITESRLVEDSTGIVVYLGDENGHTWIADRGTCEGMPGEFSHLVVDGVGTTTIVPVSTELPTADNGLDGVTAYWVEGDELAVVTANDSYSITVDGFSAVPADGDEIWLGRIRAKLRTPAFAGRPSDRRKVRPVYAQLSFSPQESERRFHVRAYENQSSTAKTWGDPDKHDDIRGLEFPGRDDRFSALDWRADSSLVEGQVRVPLGDTSVRYVEVELEVFEPDCPLEVTEIEFQGVDAEAPT